MRWGEREVSLYEIIHGHGAHWYWDPNYIPEAETDNREPLPAELVAAIETALDGRITSRKERKVYDH